MRLDETGWLNSGLDRSFPRKEAVLILLDAASGPVGLADRCLSGCLLACPRGAPGWACSPECLSASRWECSPECLFAPGGECSAESLLGPVEDDSAGCFPACPRGACRCGASGAGTPSSEAVPGRGWEVTARLRISSLTDRPLSRSAKATPLRFRCSLGRACPAEIRPRSKGAEPQIRH